MKRIAILAALSSTLLASSAFGQLALSQNDGLLPVTYANGGGGGFGGTLGNGSFTFNADAGNLNIAFTPGNSLNDNVVVYLDTKAGGFTDADMNDTQDGGRTAVSNLTRDLNDVLPILPDYALLIGSFGSVLFELNAGNTPNHLNFLQFADGVQNISIPLASIASPTTIDFVAAYASGSAYNSNESLPATVNGINQAGGNLGFGNGADGGVNPAPSQVVYDRFNRFVIPEPTTLGLLAGAGMLALRRRK